MKLGATLLLWLVPLLVFAEQMHWQGDYDKALAQAKKEHKALLVFVVKKECPLCHEILQKQFTNQPYIHTLNTKTVAVMVTYADAVYYPVEIYWTNTYPTLFFVETQQELFSSKPLYGEEITPEILKKIAAKFDK